MRSLLTTLAGFAVLMLIATPAFAQEEGDYRTRNSGDWSNGQIWERFNGAAWAPIAEPPTGSETITIVGAEDEESGEWVYDSVFVDVPLTITGTLVNQGHVEGNGNLTIGDGGTFQQDRDGGEMPDATWAEGSTLLMTGVVSLAPENRRQNFHHIVFNTPGLLSNLNMNLDSVTVGGDIRVVDTGLARWYLTSATTEEGGSVVEILGDVIVENGNFSVQGTSNASTHFVVNHYGDIDVTGGNFSIARGSQPLGTTMWYLHEGNFSMSNATTQNSNANLAGARFVFTSGATQTLTLGEGNTINALPIEVTEGTTLDMGTSVLSGSGDFVIRDGATLATANPGGIAGMFDGLYAGVDTLAEGASYVFNGTEAQVTSAMMPAVVQNLTINNPAGVTLSQETTINGVLALQAGVFDNTVPFTLGPEGSISEEGGSLLIPTASEREGEVPTTFYVDQNFPNPFNPSTVIRYGLPAASDVTIRIYNVLGQEVMTAFRGHQQAGVHEFLLNATALHSGLYIYRVTYGDQSIAKRMVLVE